MGEILCIVKDEPQQIFERLETCAKNSANCTFSPAQYNDVEGNYNVSRYGIAFSHQGTKYAVTLTRFSPIFGARIRDEEKTAESLYYDLLVQQVFPSSNFSQSLTTKNCDLGRMYVDQERMAPYLKRYQAVVKAAFDVTVRIYLKAVVK